MTRVARLLHLDDGEFPALRAQIEAQPMPRVGVPATTRRPLRIDEQARSVAALAGIRSEAAVLDLRIVNGLGMRRPVAPKPTAAQQPFSRDLIERMTAVATAMHDDYARHLDTMAVLDEISAVLTEHPEFLTSAESHPGPRLWLRRIATELAPFAAKAGA